MPREGGQHHVLGVAAELVAEAAAHVRIDHADQVLIHAQHAGEIGPEVVRRLVRGPHHQAARGGIGRGHAGARLHRHAAQALADDPLLHHALGLGEDRVGIAGLDLILVLDVLRGIRVELRRAVGQRGEDVGDRGQRLPVDHDRFDAVVGGVVGVGHHRRHRLADVADHLRRQRPVLATRRAAAGAALGRRARGGQRLGQLADVLARDDHANAGHLQRRLDVDTPDARVSVGAAHEGHPLHAGHHHVGDVGRRAGDHARILLALDLGTHELGRSESGHGAKDRRAAGAPQGARGGWCQSQAGR